MAMSRVLILAIIFIISTFTSFCMTNAEVDKDTMQTINKMVGHWYFIAELNIDSSVPVAECRTINVEKVKDNQLKISFRYMMDGEYQIHNLNAQVLHRKLYDFKTQDGESLPKFDELDVVEDDSFLVLFNKDSKQVYEIYSRTSNITEESLRTYKNIAGIEQYYLLYADHRTCNQRTHAQWRFDLGDVYHMVGTWYMVLGICPKVMSYETSCAHMNVTKSSDDLMKIQTYKEHGTIKYMRNWVAKIYYSHLYEINAKLLNPPSYTIAYYNDKEELYLHSVVHAACDAVWSRTKFLSDNSYKRYEQIAKKQNANLRQIGHLVC
ncbi:hypothetical protein PV328_003628 [Microctonus aethiopoides]|uniref:Uncharacterized protein n=1 Tax=Microctonus aethiopoides TaxID=144406 RepID=A0AA39F917_9HYME|nr:hypothetical protein PV328_003628 [Microctonus aethiopoides]